MTGKFPFHCHKTSFESNKRKSSSWLLDKQSGGIKMQEKNHFCEFEVAGELVFCIFCGEQPQIGGDSL